MSDQGEANQVGEAGGQPDEPAGAGHSEQRDEPARAQHSEQPDEATGAESPEAAERPETAERAAGAPATDHPATDLAADHSTAEHPAAGHPVADHPAAEHPAAEHLAADHPAADHSAAKHLAADHPAADHSAADHSAADHSAADRSAAEHPATDHLAADHPATDHPAADHPHPHRRRIPRPVRIAAAVLGPVLLTTAYFTVPFAAIEPRHRVLAWLILAGILALLALGMVVTTNRAMTDHSGRYPHPGLGILLLSWASILVFAASYWAMATRHGQFVGLRTRLDALYFTGVTMATVGYGDIHPTGQLARAAVLVQLVYTFAFLVSGIAALRTRTRAKMARRMGG